MEITALKYTAAIAGSAISGGLTLRLMYRRPRPPERERMGLGGQHDLPIRSFGDIPYALKNDSANPPSPPLCAARTAGLLSVLPRKIRGYIDKLLYDAVHVLSAGILQTAVEVSAAHAQVRTRKSAIGQRGTVRAAANGV